MLTSDLYIAVHWTARLSAVLFAAALAAPALYNLSARRSQSLYLGFILAHTIHFSFVVWLAKVTGGENMFPGGRSVGDAGGWPAVFGVFAFFYALAFVGLAARRAGPRARLGLRAAGRFSTAFIGFMFVSTYMPLIARSRWYALPAALVVAGVAVDMLGGRIRRLRCLGGAAGASS
jgi:hypothetical protein